MEDKTELLRAEFRKIKRADGYVIGNNGVVLKSNEIISGEIPVNERGDIQIISPFYVKRDNVLRVNLFTERGRYTPEVHNLVADAFMHRKNGYVTICKNGDYRNCDISNLMQVRRGEAIKFRRAMFGKNRYTDFYKAFLLDPRPQVFYGMPIDVQEYIVERGVVDWQPKILKFQ